MEKTKGHVNIVLIFVIIYLFVALNNDWEPSWSRRASEEAEFVAKISCSGHGKAYVDGLLGEQGKYQAPVCECNSCFQGPDCSQLIHDCPANAESGDPYFLEPFWMQKASSGAVMVAGWHRMGYTYSDNTYTSKELENRIRELHEVVGNAVTRGRFIVFGVGSTQLLNAAVHALSLANSSSPRPARVVASIPFYGLYRMQTEYFESMEFKFEGDASVWRNKSNGVELIEFVTSPNNPDGNLNKAVLVGQNAKAIHDRVYYWPHFTPIPAPADDDIMLFSLSKFTGHAGSRFGWAVVKDEATYQRMTAHVGVNTMGVSRDTQLRALQLIKTVLGSKGREIFDFGYSTLLDRWENINKTLSASDRFSLQEIVPQYCGFFWKVRAPTPAYAWIKCERSEDEDCYEVLESAKIIGRRGSRFGSEERFVRLSLIKSQDDFDLLLQRLSKLVSEDFGNKLPM